LLPTSTNHGLMGKKVAIRKTMSAIPITSKISKIRDVGFRLALFLFSFITKHSTP
jgi:hypothetical protein